MRYLGWVHSWCMSSESLTLRVPSPSEPSFASVFGRGRSTNAERRDIKPWLSEELVRDLAERWRSVYETVFDACWAADGIINTQTLRLHLALASKKVGLDLRTVRNGSTIKGDRWAIRTIIHPAAPFPGKEALSVQIGVLIQPLREYDDVQPKFAQSLRAFPSGASDGSAPKGWTLKPWEYTDIVLNIKNVGVEVR